MAVATPWDRGVYGSVTEIADAEKIPKSYVSRVLRLALLAPDLVEAILGGWADQRVVLKRLERPLPAGWGEQRRTMARAGSAMANRGCRPARRPGGQARRGSHLPRRG